jgi:hypothetical protein
MLTDADVCQMGLGLSFFKSALQMIPDSGKLSWEYERYIPTYADGC